MSDILQQLAEVLEMRKTMAAADSYVASLHAKGLDHILKKVGEEAVETLLAAKQMQISGDGEPLIRETADLWFHCMVMLSHVGLGHEQVLAELERRFGLSGLAEKAARTASDHT